MLRPAIFTFSLVIAFFSMIVIKKEGTKSASQTTETTYAYHAESLSFSDVNRLCTPDSLKTKTPFFKRPGLQSVKGNMDCNVSKIILFKNADSSLVTFVISDPQLEFEQTGFAFDAQKIKEELAHPVFVIMHHDGLITMVNSDTSISSISAAMQRDIISRFQFVKPDGNSRNWQTRELFPDGFRFMEYATLPGFSGDTIHYTKKPLRSASSGTRKNELKNSLESEAKITTDSSGKILTEVFSETFTSLAGNDSVAISGDKVRVSLIKSQSANNKITALKNLLGTKAYSRPSSLSTQHTEEEINRSALKNTLGNATFKTLMDQSRAHGIEIRDNQEALIMKLRALIVLEPDCCSQIEKILHDEGYGTPVYNVLTHSLSRAGTPAASIVLFHVITHRIQEKEMVLDLFPDLELIQNPDPDVIRGILNIAFDNNTDPDIRSAAQLTAGACSLYTRKLQQSLSDSIFSVLYSNMLNEKDTIQQLIVFGNSGNPAVIQIVKPILCAEKKSPQVTEHAINALRFIEDSKAGLLLADLLKSTNKQIKETARAVTAFRNNYFNLVE
jgi:hypothetical protein